MRMIRNVVDKSLAHEKNGNVIPARENTFFCRSLANEKCYVICARDRYVCL